MTNFSQKTTHNNSYHKDKLRFTKAKIFLKSTATPDLQLQLNCLHSHMQSVFIWRKQRKTNKTHYLTKIFPY